MYLLDTNILSALIKKTPNQHLIAKLSEVPADALFISTITLMELRYGCARIGDRGKTLWERISEELLARVRIVGLEYQEALLAGEIMAVLQKNGTPLSVEDIMIAGTALANGLSLVTDNIRHLGRVPGLKVENWLSA